MAWTQELYYGFQLTRDLDDFYSFESDKEWIGLRMADVEEAEEFADIVCQRAPRKSSIGNSGKSSPTKPVPAKKPLSMFNKDTSDTDSQKSHNSGGGKKSITESISKAFSFFKITKKSSSSPSNDKEKMSTPEDDYLTAEDVSEPSNFRHLSHIGFNAQTGVFDIKNIPPEWKRMFVQAGLKDSDLQNKNTVQTVIGVVESVRKNGTSGKKGPPPPVPPKRKGPPPPPPSRVKPSNIVQSSVSSTTQASSSIVDPTRNNLLSSIRSAGGVSALKKAANLPLPSPSKSEHSSVDMAAPNDMMASMLAKALASRNRQMAAVDSDEDDDRW